MNRKATKKKIMELLDDLEADVCSGHGMGQSTDGYHINAGLGDLTDIVECNIS